MGSAGPSWSSGVDPRNAENVCAMAKEDAKAKRVIAANSRISRFISKPSGAFDTNGAFLKVGLKRYRICGVERHLVDELAFIEPGDEYDATRHTIAPACLQPRADNSTP
jgi:hypothetical protein